jgi:hypothetical protein
MLFLGSAWGDSQLVQIHEQPISDNVEEGENDCVDLMDTSSSTDYTPVGVGAQCWGPILDLDLD